MDRAGNDADGRFRPYINKLTQIIILISHVSHTLLGCLSSCFCGFSSETSPESSFVVETALHAPFCRCFIIPHVYPHGWCRKASALPSILFLHWSLLEIQRGLEQLALKVLPSVFLKKVSPGICCNAVCDMKAPVRTKYCSFWRGRCVVWCCWNLSSCRGEGLRRRKSTSLYSKLGRIDVGNVDILGPWNAIEIFGFGWKMSF